MPCSFQIVSQMLPEIHTIEKCGFLKPIFILKKLNTLFSKTTNFFQAAGNVYFSTGYIESIITSALQTNKERKLTFVKSVLLFEPQ